MAPKESVFCEYLSPLPSGCQVKERMQAHGLSVATVPSALSEYPLNDLKVLLCENGELPHFLKELDAATDVLYQELEEGALRQMPRLVEAELGLKLGEPVVRVDGSEAFILERVELWGTSVHLAGTRLLKNGKLGKSQAWWLVWDFARARAELGRPDPGVAAPRDMELPEMLHELHAHRAYLDTRPKGPKGALTSALESILAAVGPQGPAPVKDAQMADIATERDRPAELRLRASISHLGVVALDWRSSANPYSEWSLAFGAPRASRCLLRVPCNGLVHENAWELSQYPRTGAKGRLNDLLVYTVARIVQARIQQVLATAPDAVVQRCLVVGGAGTQGCAYLADVEWGLQARDIYELPEHVPYPWRTPGAAADEQWALAVEHATGLSLPRAPLPEWRSSLVRWSHERDPEVVALAQKEAALALMAKEVARANMPETVRTRLRQMKIGPKTGWSREIAELVGIQPAYVKQWLKKNLPHEFALMYGEDGKGHASPLPAETSPG